MPRRAARSTAIAAASTSAKRPPSSSSSPKRTHAPAARAFARFSTGYGVAADARAHDRARPARARGAARAMQAALADAGRTAGDVGYVSAHGTATPFNDLMESKALALRARRRAPPTPVNSIKSALGHTLGAAAALEALACVRTLETGLRPPTPGLRELDPEIAPRRRPRSARAASSRASRCRRRRASAAPTRPWSSRRSDRESPGTLGRTARDATRK